MRLSGLLFAALLLLTCAAASAEEGISKVYSGGPASAPSANILFVGNSYTYKNDLPQLIAQLADGDAGLRAHLLIQSATRGGKTLQNLWDDDQVQRLFASHRWDVVVLQEQSLWAMTPAATEATAKSFGIWASAVKKQGGKVVLYQTWARQPNSFWYTDRRYAGLKSAKDMQAKLNAASAGIVAQTGATLAPVGSAFGAALAVDSKYPLYAEDSSHPSLAGSYLAALVLYKAVTGRALPQNISPPAAITPQTAGLMAKIAAETR